MIALCGRVRDFDRRTGRDILPFAGSRANGPDLIDAYFRSQTQRLASRLNPGGFLPVNGSDLLAAYLNREWSLDDPGIRSAFEVMGLLGNVLPPGFDQTDRDTAFFFFNQGRALLLSAYSQDATGILHNARFPVGVFRNPAPDPKGRFGGNMFAWNSEGTLIPYGTFAITRASPHPAQALDFLRFITSQREDRRFVAIADTLPVIDGVEAPGFMANFTPDGRGFPPGPTLMGPGDVGMLVARDEYLLFGPQGSVDSFLAALSRDLPAAARSDLVRGERQLLETVALNDASVESAHRLAHEYHRSAVLERKYQSIVETQNEQEASAYYMQLRLRRADSLK